MWCGTQTHFSLPFDKLRTNGSMVLPVYLLFIFALAERKNEQQKEIKYRCE